jgi:hypothetical protein
MTKAMLVPIAVLNPHKLRAIPSLWIMSASGCCMIHIPAAYKPAVRARPMIR